jgi:S1-C subfamily serine protease
MKKGICILALALIAFPPLPQAASQAAGDDPLAAILRRGGYTVSLDLTVKKKGRSTLRRALSNLVDEQPNAFATGFVVGDGLVMTAHHTVSGNLSAYKKKLLGFAPDDQLEVEARVKDCQATIVKVDEEADLALLRVCSAQKRIGAPAFQASPGQDERLLVIARPGGDKSVRHGTYSGSYEFRGRQYLAAKMEGRDGYSGSPVYNNRAEIVGVFIGYDWAQKVALITPAVRAQKLLEDYTSSPKQ